MDRTSNALKFWTRAETLQLFETGEAPPPRPVANINYMNGVAFRDHVITLPAEGEDASRQRLESLRKRLEIKYLERLDAQQKAMKDLLNRQQKKN